MTTTNLHHIPPTPIMITAPQKAYIENLIVARDVPKDAADAIREKLPRLSKKHASDLISGLVILPRRPRAEAPVNVFAKPLADLLGTLPAGKYALPRFLVEMSLRDMKMPHGDFLFVEIRNYRGRIQILRLSGAPGRFNRFRMPTSDSLFLARAIEEDPYKYTKLFADHYKVCGRCAAELTDQTSRELGLGPVCVKYFNVR